MKKEMRFWFAIEILFVLTLNYVLYDLGCLKSTLSMFLMFSLSFILILLMFAYFHLPTFIRNRVAKRIRTKRRQVQLNIKNLNLKDASN